MPALDSRRRAGDFARAPISLNGNTGYHRMLVIRRERDAGICSLEPREDVDEQSEVSVG